MGQSFTSFLFEAINNFFICLFFQFIWFFNTFKILKNAFKIKSGRALKLFLGEKYPFNFIKLCFHQTSYFLLVFGIQFLPLSFFVFNNLKPILDILGLFCMLYLVCAHFWFFQFEVALIIFESFFGLIDLILSHLGLFFLIFFL